MKMRFFLVFLLTVLQLSPILRGQELDGSDLRKQLRERDEGVNKLSLDEQLKLRAAQVKAADDPAVQEAMRKRNEAINNFRQAIQDAMLKADPSIAPILKKVAITSQLQP